MRVFASQGDLTADPWNLAPPANVGLLLVRASQLVENACKTAVFDVADDGLPEDLNLRHALRDATCAQVAVWAGANLDPLTASVGTGSAAVASKSAGGRSVTYAATDAATSAARARSAGRLDPFALSLLPPELFRQPWTYTPWWL